VCDSTTIPEGYKRCSRLDDCIHPDGPILPLSEFFKDKTHRDGKSSACKSCTYLYHVRNREKVATVQRAYYERNAESERARARRRYATVAKVREDKKRWRMANIEKQRQANREYYWRNRETRRENNARWAERNAERRKEYNRLYLKNNPERFREYSQRRRSRKQLAPGDHTKEDVALIYQRQKGRCWWCLCELNGAYHVDHRIPISRGGSNDASNLVVSCPKCNLSKRDKLPHEWIGRLL